MIKIQQLQRFELISQLLPFALTLCVCVCMCFGRLHLYVTGSCKASVSGPLKKVGHGEVCRIQEGRHTGFNTETYRARAYSSTQTKRPNTHVISFWLFLLTDASCPPVQTAPLQHQTQGISLQVDLQARWKGRPTLRFLSGFSFC